MIEKLAGTVIVPKKFKGKNIDKIIEVAKKEYFLKKFNKKEV